MAQLKEQVKAPEEELSDKEIANLTEMIEYGHKTEEEVKAMQSEIKENIQETNGEGRETGTRINDLDQKEKINIQLEQNEETRTQKKWREA